MIVFTIAFYIIKTIEQWIERLITGRICLLSDVVMLFQLP